MRTKRIGAGIRAAAGCLGDFVFWSIVVPLAIAFLLLVVTEPDVLGSELFWGVVALILSAVAVVLYTATFGHARAKQAALERELRDEQERESAAGRLASAVDDDRVRRSGAP